MRKKRIFILTLFPEYFNAFQSCGVISKALSGDRSDNFDLKLEVINIRDYSLGNYKSVDAYPYGGGDGMVMRPDVLANSINTGIIEEFKISRDYLHIIYPGPRGKTFDNQMAKEISKKIYNDKEKELVFVCGRYEGIDERFLKKYVDEYISIGNYVLTGGELAVMSILDASLRFVEGFLGNKNSSIEESFQDNKIEYPHFTKPREFEGLSVPEVLLGGHHKNIEEYKIKKSLEMTKRYRPDLLEGNVES